MSLYSTDHLGVITDAYAGPETGFWENARAAYDQQFRVDSMAALPAEVSDAWQSSLQRYKDVTGEDVWTSLPDATMSTYIAAVMDEETPWIAKTGNDAQTRANAIALNNRMKALNDPNIKSLDQIIQEIVQKRAEITANTADLSGRQSWAGWFGSFAGGVAGSLSTRDPLNLITAGFGGFGKSIATRIATEAAIGGTVEAGNQFLAVEPTREMLGEPDRSPWESILYAATGAGIIRGAGEGIAAVGGRLLERLDRPVADGADAFDLSDDQLRQMFSRADTPSNRAGEFALDAQQSFNALNPYTASDSGMRRFIGELSEVQEIMAGTTSTGVRQLPLEQLPVDLDNLSFEMRQVKETEPVMFAEFSTAQTKLDEIDAALSEVEARVANINQADGLQRIDPDTADLARSYISDLDSPDPKVKANAERQLQMIAESVGPDLIAKQVSDAAIAPRKELQALRKSRKAALRDFKQARDAVDAVVARNAERARFKEMLEQQKATAQVGLFAKANDEPYVGPLLEHQTVKSAVAAATDAQEAIPVAARNVTEVEDGIDVGNGLVLSKDFTIDLVDEFGNARSMSAKEIFDELADDDRLVAAMGQCAL